ncbi:efflux transporter periplasmic adaptor subunit [Rhodobacteraceae bacterium]|nr:efflux transporter periplasmic adaptor subunit [Paracoccaceae bacterium]
MRFLRRCLTGLLLIAVTFGLMAYAGSMVWGALEARWAEEPSQRPQRERVFAANVVVIEPETIRPVLTTFGELRARRTLELRAATAGAIMWISEQVEEGGQVKAGDVLVRLNPVEAQSAQDTAGADLAEAEADLRDAERLLLLSRDEITGAKDQARLRANALARQQDLLERGVGSTAAVEIAELALATANGAILSSRQAEASAEARIDQAKTTLDRRRIALADAKRGVADTEIAAEFDGVLSEVAMIPGGRVSSGEALARLVDPDALEVAFRVSTPQYTRLLNETGDLIGADVIASIDILGVDLEARGIISRESANVGDGQTGRLLFARLDNTPGFRPGDFVSIRIEEPPLENVTRLPAFAVDAAGTVLVLGEEDRLEVANVTVLRREGDDVIVRARNLRGREVVAERTPLLGAGIRIGPIRPEGQEAPAEPELLALDPDRRARLVAFVEGNQFMPDEAKTRVLSALKEDRVPAQMVERIESRMGG